MHGETQKRSALSEERLSQALQEAGVAQLAGADEIWVALDSSDLRKPHAERMEALMQVRDLDGELVPGYRVLNALGITPGARGLLYHRLFSSQEAGFESEPREYRQAVRSVGEGLSRLEGAPAEGYNFFARNCARSTALAVMEEFGLGNIALSPFPGFGGTGWMCGGVTGGLIALGLYFGSDDLQDFEAVGATIGAAREFMPRFEEEVGAVVCPSIHEDVVFGRYMDPAASPENMEALAQAKGFEKCGLLPGMGARLAAEIIIDSLA